MIENPCDSCRGEGRTKISDTLKIDIPKGVSDGNRLCSRGRGDAGSMGGSSGDLYVDVNVKQHPLFERDEDDLFHELSIPFTLATLGGTVMVPTLEGKVSLKIPPGTPSNKSFRIKDQGMPNLRVSSRKGDLYVRIIISVPTKLTKDQRNKLVEFSKSCGDEDVGADEGFMDKMKKIL